MLLYSPISYTIKTYASEMSDLFAHKKKKRILPRKGIGKVKNILKSACKK